MRLPIPGPYFKEILRPCLKADKSLCQKRERFICKAIQELVQDLGKEVYVLSFFRNMLASPSNYGLNKCLKYRSLGALCKNQ